MNIGSDKMDNERIIKLQHFFSVDIKIKKELFDIAPQSLDGYMDEESVSKYTDKLNDSLIYIFNELKCVTLDIFGKDSHVFKKICLLEKNTMESFYNCGFDINELKSFYQKYISNMDPAFIDNVKNKCVGYAFSGTSPIETALSISEILHFIHSYIVNNEKILQSLPLLNEKNNNYNYPISLRGIKNPMFEQIFKMFPNDLDCGWTDMVAIND